MAQKESKLADETQEKIRELQLSQQRLSVFAQQRQSLELQKLEIEQAQKELKDAKEAYKAVAGVLIKKDPKQLEAELKEEQEKIDIRLESIKKQEDKIREKAKELQQEITKSLQA